MDDRTRVISLILITFIIFVSSFVTALATRSMSGGNLNEAELEKALTDFIIKNPTVVGDAVRKAYEIEQQKADQEAAQKVKDKITELEKDQNSPVIGNPEGDVALVEFFDYNCGYCKRVLPDLNAMIAEDKNLKVVFKELPILGDMSRKAALVSIAAYKADPSKYLKLHTELLNKGARQEAQIYTAVKAAGYDEKQIKLMIQTPEIKGQLDKHVELAGEIGVRGTPAFVIGGELIRGAQGREVMENAVKSARN